MHRLILTAVVAAAILATQTGCAAILLGYVVGDAIAKDKATATCRANLQTINQARIAKHEEPFPDQCGR